MPVDRLDHAADDSSARLLRFSIDLPSNQPSYLHGHSALFRASSRQPRGNGWKAAALIPNRF